MVVLNECRFNAVRMFFLVKVQDWRRRVILAGLELLKLSSGGQTFLYSNN